MELINSTIHTSYISSCPIKNEKNLIPSDFNRHRNRNLLSIKEQEELEVGEVNKELSFAIYTMMISMSGTQCTAFSSTRVFANPSPTPRSPSALKWDRVKFPVALKSIQASNANRDVGELAKEATESAKVAVSEGVDKIKSDAEVAKEKTMEGASSIGDKAKAFASEAQDNVSSAKERTDESIKGGVEALKKNAEATNEKTKEGISGVVENLQNIGEDAKKNVEGAWNGAADEAGKVGKKLDEAGEAAAKKINKRSLWIK